jgi:tryptophan synthase alpha chain
MPTAARQSRSIADSFHSGHSLSKIGLVPFIPAGYPDLPTTVAALRALDAAGAAVIEVGFPFSDPIADGPTIQEAFTEALAKKLKVADIFAAVAAVAAELSAPLVAMVSYSIVHRYGIQKFCAQAKSVGFSGLILPDLPPPEAQKFAALIREAGLDLILLIAPTTAPARRKEIAQLCTGFVYYLSVSGITGERDRLPPDLADNIRQIKQYTERPICVGFGIHKAAQVAELANFADGAIVGSAIVKRMKQHAGESPEAIAAAIGAYCRELQGN